VKRKTEEYPLEDYLANDLAVTGEIRGQGSTWSPWNMLSGIGCREKVCGSNIKDSHLTPASGNSCERSTRLGLACTCNFRAINNPASSRNENNLLDGTVAGLIEDVDLHILRSDDSKFGVS
jgi:hypothetical protein